MLRFRTIISVRKYCVDSFKKMKYLNVAEKNDAAKTISQHLSGGNSRRREGFSPYNKIYDFQANVRGQNSDMLMTSVSGHLLNFQFVATYKNWLQCDPIQLFDAPVIKSCSEDFQRIKKTLEKEVKSCHALIVWTDCDREGENIGFEIIDVCRAIKPNLPVYRAKFSEITTIAVKRALDNLIEPDKKMSEAVDVRMELDLRIGAAFTRFQTLRLQAVFPNNIERKLISYGSCQIPTLGFVAQRYKAAENFVAQTFWKIKMSHKVDDLTVEFIWARNRLFDKQCCEAYLIVCQTKPEACVTNVTKKPKSKWRPLPLDTVELEKLGSRKLKLTAKETMTVAEKLYTQGIISYPRTETNMFSNEMNLSPLIEMQTPHSDWGNFANRVLQWGPNPRKGTKSDQAHPPIHPTKYAPNLGGNEKKVYELIVRHFLACVSRDATGSETIVNCIVADEEFTATGLCIHERNYLDVYPYDRWNAKEIHSYEVGNLFQPTDISMPEGTTTAPSMLTEADLIALMEKHGIGTDATHAEHINTIKEREYIGVVDRGFLVPGQIGMGLVEGYDAMNLTLAQPKLRADLEKDLKLICEGRRNPNDVLKEQVEKYREAYKIISEKAVELDQSMGNRLNEAPRQAPTANVGTKIEEVLKCPKCNKFSMALKVKKDNTGHYIGCIGFPDCRNAIWLPDIKEIKVTDETCPRCGPGYKKVSLKFKQMTALSLLNATSNIYTSCLVCDSVLKDILNISDDCVRKVNPTNNNNNNNNSRTTINTINNTNRNLTTSTPNTTRTNNSSGWNLNSSSNQNSNRNNTTNRVMPPPPPPSSNNNSSSINNATPSNNTNNRGWNSNAGTNSSGWGNPPQNNSNNRGRNSNVSPTSSNQWNGGGQPNNNFSLRDNNNRNSWNGGANTSNTFNGNNNNNRDNSGWSSAGSNNNSTSNDGVLCGKCNQPATKLTVKKDGPNKGRTFYKCNHTQTCNFFQWGDENQNRPPPTSSTTTTTNSWGNTNNSNSGGPSTSTSGNSNSGTTARAKRKCGICRSEGHTKLKCPRRGDLNIS